MTITPQQYAELLERIAKLEATSADHASRWDRYVRTEITTMDLVELLQAKYNDVIKHVQMLYGIMKEHGKEIFPDRFDGSLSTRTPPKKLV